MEGVKNVFKKKKQILVRSHCQTVQRIPTNKSVRYSVMIQHSFESTLDTNTLYFYGNHG